MKKVFAFGNLSLTNFFVKMFRLIFRSSFVVLSLGRFLCAACMRVRAWINRFDLMLQRNIHRKHHVQHYIAEKVVATKSRARKKFESKRKKKVEKKLRLAFRLSLETHSKWTATNVFCHRRRYEHRLNMPLLTQQKSPHDPKEKRRENMTDEFQWTNDKQKKRKNGGEDEENKRKSRMNNELIK